MEKNRGSKVIAIVALVVAVVGLSLGFAAFSNTLVISSSATVTPNEDTFSVVFSSSETGLATNGVTGVTTTGATVGTATIVNDGENPTISGLTAGFTAPGQSVSYTFYLHNDGEYESFLKSIAFANATGASTTKACTIPAESTATEALVNAACGDISLTVTLGEGENTLSVTGSETGLSRSLAKDASEAVTVTIAYAEGNNRADGAFNVAFGDISLTYSSAK